MKDPIAARTPDGTPLTVPMRELDLSNKNPVIEIATCAVLITDMIHHRRDRVDRLEREIASAAKARGMTTDQSDKRNLAVQLVALFSDPQIQAATAELATQHRQFAIIPSDANGAPQFYWDIATAEQEEHREAPEIHHHISRLKLDGVTAGLQKLGLEFKIVPLRPSIASDLAATEFPTPQP